MVSSLVNGGAVFGKPFPLRLEKVLSTETFFRSVNLLVMMFRSFSSCLIPSLSIDIGRDGACMDVKRCGLGGPGRSFSRSLGGAGRRLIALPLISVLRDRCVKCKKKFNFQTKVYVHKQCIH